MHKWIHLEHVSEFKYLGCVLDESGTNEAERSRKVEIGRRVTRVNRFLVNARSRQLDCASVLHEYLVVPVLLYGSKTMIWREKVGLGLGLFRWTTSEVSWVSGEWIKA